MNVWWLSRGEVVNGGFGLVLDGTEEAAGRAALVLGWDVSNGVARRLVLYSFHTLQTFSHIPTEISLQFQCKLSLKLEGYSFIK